MKFYLMSDVHNDFGEYKFVPEKFNPDYPLLIAGDWGTAKNKYENILREFSKHFCSVVFVTGNHDYYDGSIQEVNDFYTDLSKELKNFHFLNNSSVIIHGVKILGCTLWTDVDNQNPLKILEAAFVMNDFTYIKELSSRHENKGVKTMIDMNLKSTKFLKENINDDYPVLVMTHHAPSSFCIQEKYKDSKYNHFYCSDNLEEVLLNENVIGWVHGHLHAQDTLYYGERKLPIFRNARGYHFRESCSYDFDTETDNKIFEINLEGF